MLTAKKSFAGVCAAVIAVICLWQVLAFAAEPLSPTQPSAGNASDFFTMLQSAGVSPATNLGPVSLGATYDSTLGGIASARYARAFGDNWAAGVLGEYGPNNYRINGTVGAQVWEDAQLKFSSEYLNQRLPFYFDSGNIDARVSQSAYGLQLRQNLDGAFMRNIQAGGYWAKAYSESLPSYTIIRGSFAFTNERNLAGSTSRSFDIGSDFSLSPTTLLNAKLLYDDIDYDTKLTSASGFNRSGLGGALRLDHLINNRTKISLNAEKRALQDSFGSELHWLPGFMPVEMSLMAQRLISNDHSPHSNVVGLNLSLALWNDEGYSTASEQPAAMGELVSWVKDPAVRMDRVQVRSEQRTSLSGPVALSISPSGGPVTGGGTVTITGTNFLPGVVVTFSGVNATVISVTPTQIVVTVPDLSLVVQDSGWSLWRMLAQFSPISTAHAATQIRTVDVEVINPDGKRMTFKQAYNFTVSDPVLSSITPNTGTIAGGETVTLSGSVFTGATSVTFDGVAGTSLTVVNDTTLTIVTPSHAAGAVDIVVTTPQGSVTEASGFTYLALPSITSISPTEGSTAGGTSITLTGTGFTGATGVTLDGVAATSVTVVSDTTVTAVTPAHSAAVADVEITTPSGNDTLTDGFTYISAPDIISLSPATGTMAGGTSVTLTGTALTGTTSVTLGGDAASNVTVVNSTTVTFDTPAHAAGAVDVVLTTAAGSDTLTNGFTYAGAPTVTSISPNTDFTAGGTSVTVTGTFFTGATAVNFGSTSASFTVDSDSSITATAPAGSAGTVDITVTTAGGTSATSSADEFTYTTPPAIIYVTSTLSSGSLGGFSGADTKCNTDSGKPGGFAAGYTYKALLNGNNATTSGVSYYRTNGTTLIATATGGNLVGAASLINSISATSNTTWTGSVSGSCSNWTLTISSVGIGSSGSSSSTWYNSGTASCAGGRRLYCVSQ